MRSKKKIAVYVLTVLILAGAGVYLFVNHDAATKVTQVTHDVGSELGLNRAVDRLDLDELDVGAMQTYIDDFTDKDLRASTLSEKEWKELERELDHNADYAEWSEYIQRVPHMDDDMHRIANGIPYFNKTEDTNPPEDPLPLSYTDRAYRHEPALTENGIRGRIRWDIDVYGADEDQDCLLEDAHSVSFTIASSRGTPESTTFTTYYIRDLHSDTPDVRIEKVGEVYTPSAIKTIIYNQAKKKSWHESNLSKSLYESDTYLPRHSQINDRFWYNVLRHVGKWDKSLTKTDSYWERLYEGVTIIPSNEEDMLQVFGFDESDARNEYFDDYEHPRATMMRIYNIEIDPDLPDSLFVL